MGGGKGAAAWQQNICIRLASVNAANDQKTRRNSSQFRVGWDGGFGGKKQFAEVVLYLVTLGYIAEHT